MGEHTPEGRDNLPADVVRLVIAARIVAYESQQPEALRELDEAAEAFADRVPWNNEPGACPTCGEVPRMVWIGHDPPEPYGEVCGCPEAAEALSEARGDKAGSDEAARAAIQKATAHD